MIRNAQIGQHVIVDDVGVLAEGVIRHIDTTTFPYLIFVQLKGESDYTETTASYCYTLDAGLRLALERAAGQDELEHWQ